MSIVWTDRAYVATENNGQIVGFFCYSINTKKYRLPKIVIADKAKRGNGYGKEMLHLAVQYVFQLTGATAVQLNVFNENIAAKQCYEKVCFIERTVDKNVFAYKDELWSRCNMIILK